MTEPKTTQDVTELLGIYWHLLQRGDIASARATRQNLEEAKSTIAKLGEQTLRRRMKQGVEEYMADLHALHTTPAIKFWLRLVLHISLLVVFCGRQLTRAEVRLRCGYIAVVLWLLCCTEWELYPYPSL